MKKRDIFYKCFIKISLIIVFIVLIYYNFLIQVEANIYKTSQNNADFLANVTFYDYFGKYDTSDTSDNNHNDHYSFENFNKIISDYSKINNMEYPLYFGDFNQAAGSANNPEKNPLQGQTLNGNAFRFYWAINRANRNSNYSASLQGIINKTLDSNGNITQNGIGDFLITDENSKEYIYTNENVTMINGGDKWIKTEDINGRSGSLQLYLAGKLEGTPCERVKISANENNYLTNNRYLTFEVLNNGDGNSGSLYISLEDNDGNKIGGWTEYLSTLYSDNKMPKKGEDWKRIIVDLHSLKGNSLFDFSRISNMYLGYWANGDIYINDILFINDFEIPKVKVPYFNKDFINDNVGKTIEGLEFPFKKRIKNNCYYYSFSSNKSDNSNYVNGIDVVRINENTRHLDYWFNVDENDDNTVLDMNGVTGWGEKKNSPGFFPFNQAEDDSNISKLNYGFGAEIEIPFKLTENGNVKGLNGDDIPIEFNFKGDDDVWVFIDDNLILDMGGAHSQATGNINFNTKIAKVDSVVDGSLKSNSLYQNVIKSEEQFILSDDSYINGDINKYNTDKVHVLKLFYMERGMIESNLYIDFNFIPLDNQVVVEKEVDISGVNDLFKDEAVNIFENIDFSFNISQNKSKVSNYDYKLWIDGIENNRIMNGESFSLKDRYIAKFISKFNKDSRVFVEEVIDDRFTTTWITKDLTEGVETILGEGIGNITNEIGIESNHRPYASMTHYIKFINKVKTGNLSIGKEVIGFLETEKLYSFSVNINSILGEGVTSINYYGKYCVGDEERYTTVKNGKNVIQIRAGEVAEIIGIPVNTGYSIEEILDEGYEVNKTVVNGIENQHNSNIVNGMIDSITDNHKVTYINEKIVRDLVIKKLDVEDNTILLEGTKFKIYKTEDDAKEGINAIKNPNNLEEDWISISDVNGQAIFNNLPYGEYWIVEVEAHVGYELLKESIKVIISKESPGTVEITIKNRKKIILPSTGGKGSFGFIIVGLITLCSSLIILKKLINK